MEVAWPEWSRDSRSAHRGRDRSCKARRAVQRSPEGEPQVPHRGVARSGHRPPPLPPQAPPDPGGSAAQGMRDLEARMGGALEPCRQHLENLTTIPGAGDVAAHVIAGEVGLDMTRFPTASHLISWAGLCPRLVSAAWAAVKTKGTYLQAQFQRLRARRGAKKAIIAVAASMLTAAYHILRDSV